MTDRNLYGYEAYAGRNTGKYILKTDDVLSYIEKRGTTTIIVEGIKAQIQIRRGKV